MAKVEEEFLDSLIESLSYVEDPRVEGRTMHNLVSILVISVLAMLCGAEGVTDIEAFGKSRYEWLSKFLDIESGIPSHDTFARVLAIIDSNQLEESFAGWVQLNFKGKEKPRVISLDGKSVKGTERGFQGVRPLHIVSAFSHEYGLTLMQRSSSSSGQAEGPVAVECLEKLDIKESIILADAGLSSKRVTRQIRHQKGDYIVPLKKNQRHTLKEVEEIFSKKEGAIAITEDSNHGRQDIRQCRLLSASNLSLKFKEQWVDAKSIFAIKRYRKTKDKRFFIQKTDSEGKQYYERNHESFKEAENTIYYVSSAKLTPKEALSLVRTHWGIENQLHWTLDVAFREDECRVKAKKVANALSIARKIALNLIRSSKTKGSIRQRIKMAAWNTNFLEEIIITS